MRIDYKILPKKRKKGEKKSYSFVRKVRKWNLFL